ncbi:MAG: hypothetical protein HC927_00285 [Deltaproteobacteria bacterium]|nr:hypothetical protein [Deltaproteobacteria bacterium]
MLFSFATGTGVIAPDTAKPLVVVVALTMALTPLLMLVFDRVVRPRVGTRERPPYDEVHGGNPVIIAGFGRFGQICARLLTIEGIGMTVLEADSDQVELLRKFGRKVYYGDASRYDLLHAAGADSAKLLIIAIDKPEKVLELVHTVRKHWPHLKLLARANQRLDAYDLLEAGVDHVYRETFDSALRMGVDALVLLGRRAHQAHRVAQRFRRQDEAFMRELAGKHRDENFVALVRERNAEIEAVLKQDRVEGQEGRPDHGWDAAPLIDEVGGSER